MRASARLTLAMAMALLVSCDAPHADEKFGQFCDTKTAAHDYDAISTPCGSDQECCDVSGWACYAHKSDVEGTCVRVSVVRSDTSSDQPDPEMCGAFERVCVQNPDRCFAATLTAAQVTPGAGSASRGRVFIHMADNGRTTACFAQDRELGAAVHWERGSLGETGQQMQRIVSLGVGFGGRFEIKGQEGFSDLRARNTYVLVEKGGESLLRGQLLLHGEELYVAKPSVEFIGVFRLVLAADASKIDFSNRVIHQGSTPATARIESADGALLVDLGDVRDGVRPASTEVVAGLRNGTLRVTFNAPQAGLIESAVLRSHL